MLDSLVARWEQPGEETGPGLKGASPAPSDLVAFNPNTATAAELVALGMPEHISRRVVQYTAKGGKFRVRRDLLKIYGLDTALYSRLEPYLLLPDKYERPSFANVPRATGEKSMRADNAAPVRVDVNLADTSQLIKVRGIGAKLSQRIVDYRARLGGFVSLEQLREVYGLKPDVVDRMMMTFFVASDFVPDRIAVNTAGLPELSTHPYLSKAIAQAIVAYRFQHGEFASIEDLGNIQALDVQTIQKIAPYLEFNTK